MKTKTTLMLVAMAYMTFGVPFQHMRFDQNIDTNGIQSIKGNSDGSIMLQSGGSVLELPQNDGITFMVQEDDTINFNLQDEVLGQKLGNPLGRILVNGKTLASVIDEIVTSQVEIKLQGIATASEITNSIRGMIYNPLWGKKLAVIGDSLISSPTRETSYPAFIAQRNNMTLVHNGRGGEKLCEHRYDDQG